MSDLVTVPSEGGAAAEIARLEAEILSKRERVTRSLGELRHQWQGATSWRRLLTSRPVVWAGVGLCVGFIVGYGARVISGRRALK
jgi:hypothetical protein